MIVVAVIVIVLGYALQYPLASEPALALGRCIYPADARTCYMRKGYEVRCVDARLAMINTTVHCTEQWMTGRYADEMDMLHPQSFQWTIMPSCDDMGKAQVAAASAIETSAYKGITVLSTCSNPNRSEPCVMLPVSAVGGFCTSIWAQLRGADGVGGAAGEDIVRGIIFLTTVLLFVFLIQKARLHFPLTSAGSSIAASLHGISPAPQVIDPPPTTGTVTRSVYQPSAAMIPVPVNSSPAAEEEDSEV